MDYKKEDVLNNSAWTDNPNEAFILDVINYFGTHMEFIIFGGNS